MTEKQVPFLKAIIPIITLIVTMLLNNIWGNGESMIPLIFSTVVACIVAKTCGFKWNELESGILKTFGAVLQALLILMIIGLIIGAWVLGGIVPTIIYYGVNILSPKFFLAGAFLVCILASVATGSSWTAIGTLGVALIGIGQGLSVPAGMTAGAIVSGAYFGDKLSPLSENTNMGSSLVNVNVYEHIKHLMYSSIPAFAISLIIFILLGLNYGSNNLELESVNVILEGIKSQFEINPFLLLLPFVIILVAIFKVPAIPGLLISYLVGVLAAIFVQGHSINEIIIATQYGYKSETGIEMVDNLLTKGGLNNMMYTVSLIICATSFGGTLDTTGMLKSILDKIKLFLKSRASIIGSATLTSTLINIFTGDQALSIILPTSMYKDVFIKNNLALKNLSRCAADGGTVTSPIVPWNVCGVYVASTLGVSTLSYLPYSFFNLLSPIFSIILGITGISIVKASYKNLKQEEKKNEKD